MPRRAIRRTLLPDADDTLWESNIYFIEASARFGVLLGACGIDPQAADRAAQETQLELIPTLGYGPASYLAGLELAVERLLRAQGQGLTPELAARVRACGAVVADPPMRLAPGAVNALRALRPTSRLILVTKGDSAFQRAKLARSGLAPLFDDCLVLPEKDEAAYRQLVRDLALDPATTWMIGNSPKSDINPALAAGLGAIYIPHPHTWSAELVPLERPDITVILDALADLVAYFSPARSGSRSSVGAAS
ncbi:MAG: HAD family hydrolase [Chloroflexota bacterium]